MWRRSDSGGVDGSPGFRSVSSSPLAALAVLALAAPAAADTVYADVGPTQVTLGNGLVHRTWSRSAFGTTALVDERTGFAAGAGPDFQLELYGGAALASSAMTATDVSVANVADGGVAVTFVLVPAPLPPIAAPAGSIQRTYTLWPDVAGFQVDTVVALPGSYTGYTLERVAVPGALATAHHFNGGYDWRGSDSFSDWSPTVTPFAGSHAGQDHRHTTSRHLARRHRAVALARHRRQCRHHERPARLLRATARELRLVTRRVRRHRGPRARRARRRPHLPGPVRGRRPRRQSGAVDRAHALRRAGSTAAPRARVHRVRHRRRRRGVAALRLPDPARVERVEGRRRRVQLERRRPEPHLDRREGRHGPRRDRAPGRDRAADRHRDVRARRRLAGGIGRLVSRLARLSGAAQGDHWLPRPLPDSEFAAVRDVLAQRGGMRARAVDVADGVQPGVVGLSEQPDLGVRGDRRRRSRCTTSRSPMDRRTRPASASGTRTASALAAC